MYTFFLWQSKSNRKGEYYIYIYIYIYIYMREIQYIYSLYIYDSLDLSAFPPRRTDRDTRLNLKSICEDLEKNYSALLSVFFFIYLFFDGEKSLKHWSWPFKFNGVMWLGGEMVTLKVNNILIYLTPMIGDSKHKG